MKDKIYKSMYEKMQTSKEMDERIKNKVIHYDRYPKNRKNVLRIFGEMAAAFAIVILLLQVQPIRAAVMDVISHFTNRLIIEENGTNQAVIEMEGDYLPLNPAAPKEDCTMDSILQVSEALGIPLLESSDAFKVSGGISYYPYVSGTGALNGVMIIDTFYAMGDLTEVKLDKSGEDGANASISYRKGKEYNSPISVQMTIRSNENDSVDYRNHELEYAGINWYLDKDDTVSDINIYEIPTLNVKTVMFTSASDGPENMERNKSITTAMFLYGGVEYSYSGAVSQNTMKEFLNTLREGEMNEK